MRMKCFKGFRHKITIALKKDTQDAVASGKGDGGGRKLVDGKISGKLRDNWTPIVYNVTVLRDKIALYHRDKVDLSFIKSLRLYNCGLHNRLAWLPNYLVILTIIIEKGYFFAIFTFILFFFRTTLIFFSSTMIYYLILLV